MTPVRRWLCVLCPSVLAGLALPAWAGDGNDSILRDAIRQRLALEVPSDRILVRVDDGNVVLDGVVDDQRAKQAATAAALATGVQAIVNNLLVASDPPDDYQLQSAVWDAFRLGRLRPEDAETIVVHARRGEVTLEGAVSDRQSRQEAARLTETVPGVKSVRNRLTVVGLP